MSIDTSVLADLGRRAGLCAVGFCRAEPFADAARALDERKRAGLHGGMQFTYRNPQRSTDPARLVPGAAALVVGALEFGAGPGDRPDDGGVSGAGSGDRPDDGGVSGAGSGDRPDGGGVSGAGSGDRPDDGGVSGAGSGDRPDGGGVSGAGSGDRPDGGGVSGAGSGDRPDGGGVSGAGPGDRPDGSGGHGGYRSGGGSPHARVAAYARADYYAPLRAALEAVAGALRAEGHRAVVSADENGLVDRAAAHRAAIGWWGKNSNILVPGTGSLVVLGAVVTDAPLVSADPEPVADGCGSCRRCLDGCPTGAIVAPGTVDARRCLAWLVQADGVFDPDYRVALGDRIYGCDDCSEVCPPNRVHLRPAAGAGREIGAPARVSVLDMLDASDEDLMADFGRWYIPRRQPRYLRRNALVVLANVGQRSDPRVRAAVDDALGDPDPVIRAHAVWCARRLGLSLDALTDPGDPLVRAELERPVPLRAV